MGDISAHFDSAEFACSCCGKTVRMSDLLIQRLEKLYNLMQAKAVFINSGYRCLNNPYGFATDAHRRCIAADIKVQKQDGTFYSGEEIAEAAELVGFGGNGIMEPISCHVDTRDKEPYTNSFWHGNETTQEDFPAGHTFVKGRFEHKHTITIMIDDNIIYSGGIL